jgi:hypothetical protein
VSQDQDLNVDVYDARVDGGIAAQNPLPPPAACAGETSCRASPAVAPAFGVPSSATITGEGNLTPQPAAKAKPKKILAKCPKHKKRIHGRCLKRKSTKKSKKARKHA